MPEEPQSPAQLLPDDSQQSPGLVPPASPTQTSLNGAAPPASFEASPMSMSQQEQPSANPNDILSSSPTVGAAPPSHKSKKLRWLIAGAVIVLLLAVGYVFAFYLPNTPENVYSASLTNSGLALDKLIDYSKAQAQASYKSVSLDGAVHVKSPSGSYDVSLNGAANKDGNADLHFKEDALGENFTTDVLSVKVAGNTTPDVYFRVSGVKHFLDSAGLNSLDNLDGQWIVVDHTLIDTYLSSLKKSAGSNTNSPSTTAPTYAEVQDALAKAQAVNKQYLFTADPSKAVLANEKFIGKETSNGRTVNHYKVGYNKAHLESYVSALAKALDSSTLNGWSKNINDGKSLSQTKNFSSLEKSAKNAKTDYTFDLWADTKTKLISKITFADPSDKSSIFTITQGYTGGSEYPFGVSVSGKDSTTNDPEKVTLNATLDTTTNKVNATFSSSTTASDGTTTSSGSFDLTPGNSTVKVSAPAKAKSITDILLSLGLGGLTDGALQSASQAQSTNPFAITE